MVNHPAIEVPPMTMETSKCVSPVPTQPLGWCHRRRTASVSAQSESVCGALAAWRRAEEMRCFLQNGILLRNRGKTNHRTILYKIDLLKNSQQVFSSHEWCSDLDFCCSCCSGVPCFFLGQGHVVNPDICTDVDAVSLHLYRFAQGSSKWQVIVDAW